MAEAAKVMAGTVARFGLTAAGLAAVWLGLAPPYAPHFDAINFALAVEDFEPLLHQPQPPGYPLVVVLARLFRPLVREPHTATFAAGLLAATVAAYFLWRLSRDAFGRRAAIFAVVLLATHPVFWLAGIRSQARLFLAAGAVAVAWLAWRTIQESGPSRRLTSAAAALALAAGFRPELLWMLSPMLVLAASRRRVGIGEGLAATSAGAAITAVWLIPLVETFGGWRQFGFVLWHYAREQFGGSSLLFGAPSRFALEMMLAALTWNGLGGLCWAWALPAALSSAPNERPSGAVPFLAWWLLPPLLWHGLVHAGDPEHTLVSVPALCLAGGWVLARWSSGSGRRAVAAGLIAGSLGVLMFLRSFPRPDVGYGVISRPAAELANLMKSLSDLGNERPLFLISCEHAGIWRPVSYYRPEHRLLVLHGTLEHPGHPARHMLYHHRRRLPPPVEGDRSILVPAGHRLVFLLPREDRIPQWIEGPQGPNRAGALYYLDLPVRAGLEFRAGAYRLSVVPASLNSAGRVADPPTDAWAPDPTRLAGQNGLRAGAAGRRVMIEETCGAMRAALEPRESPCGMRAAKAAT